MTVEEAQDGQYLLTKKDDGLSQGMDRLKCVGNAVMPQQILPIFRAIVEIEEQTYDQ